MGSGKRKRNSNGGAEIKIYQKERWLETQSGPAPPLLSVSQLVSPHPTPLPKHEGQQLRQLLQSVLSTICLGGEVEIEGRLYIYWQLFAVSNFRSKAFDMVRQSRNVVSKRRISGGVFSFLLLSVWFLSILLNFYARDLYTMWEMQKKMNSCRYQRRIKL